MAFRHNSLGSVVATDPAAAHAKLSELFAQHKTRDAVARELSVDARTLARWITRLVAAGLGDPRHSPSAAEPSPLARRVKRAVAAGLDSPPAKIVRRRRGRPAA